VAAAAADVIGSRRSIRRRGFMRKRRFFGLLALFAALTLVTAACADDDEGGGGTTGGGGGGAAACDEDEFGCVEYAEGEPIHLGTLLSISGPTASLGTDSNRGVELAIDYLDGTLDGTPGTVLDREIEVTQEDDGCAAEGGQAGGTALAADETIVAVIGTTCSSAALGVADTILSDAGVLLFSPSNTNPGLTSEEAHEPFYARTAHNDLIQGAIVAEFVFNELGVDTAATINDESPYADGLAAAFRDTFESLGGTITGIEQVQSTDEDMSAVLRSLAEGDPGVVYGPNFNPVCAYTYAQSEGILPAETINVGSDGCLATEFFELAGSPGGDYFASIPDLTVFEEGAFYSDEFLPAYREQFGEAPTAAFHAHAFDAAGVLFQAIEEVAIEDGGSLLIPRTALKDAVLATSGYEGVSGLITCTPLGDCATDVAIGIFEYPDWPVEGGDENAAPVYADTKSLEDVT
jgi:branched-chain amino acid transport system substrate-binding protein